MANNFELLKAIKEKNMTQRQLAEKVGIHESEISLIVNRGMEPDESKKKKIARALGVKIKDIF